MATHREYLESIIAQVAILQNATDDQLAAIEDECPGVFDNMDELVTEAVEVYEEM